MTKILLTGANGGVGRRLRRLLPAFYPNLRLSDLTPPDDLQPHEEFVAADLADLAQVEAAVAGVDGIIHLGGLSTEYDWADILQSNIIGAYNLFEAARKHNVRRVVFPSSNQAVGFYPRHRRLGTDVTVRPSSRYGLSKAFGEAVAALYADKHGLRTLCIRIGRVHDLPEDERRLALWISPRDFVQLIRIGLEHPDIHFDLVYGLSSNDRSWYDNTRAYELGYSPEDRAEDHREHAMAEQAKLVRNPLADRFMGGRLCTVEYSGDLERSGT
ncbi:NAD-dependent epimerase/dehydratase family protein [Nitrospirillum iridis]|uniref:Uronate dehydrogenase n=1 Tax=Nitrospirillum iridis TaxID=765888 RepID=A0A7X0B3Y8_9PROT|nr:NAD(P)-dependent oxidoreductase [Nitrospirillum iridis]MBB6255322.1 uronate dehydrogenase [Nitrospirillum iridis]